MAQNRHANEIDKLTEGYRSMRLKLIRESAAFAVAFFKRSFTVQGFMNNTLEKWPERKGGPRNNGRGILIDKGVLKRAVRIKRTGVDGAVVGVDEAIPYAQIHNEGGEIEITPKMRRFFWAMYYRYAGQMVYNTRTKKAADTKRNRGLNEMAAFYRNMAITNKKTITIPKRQFIGDSAKLDREILNHITKEMNAFFNVE